MDINPNLAAALALLTETLDDDVGADIAASLRKVAEDVAAAVPSYIGLTVTQRDGSPPFGMTAMEEGADPADVCSSLLLPLPGRGPSPLTLVLYAAAPGAFVDLVADLAWILDRPLTDFAVDEHLRPPAWPDIGRSLHVMSVVNQAVGVLVGRGHRLEDAEQELTARAARAGHTRYEAARIILRRLADGPPDRSPEVW